VSFFADLAKFMASHANKENGVFITMNPGYAGRTQLNFDVKHWMINSMDVPDFIVIIQL